MGCKSMYNSCCLCFIKSSTQTYTICVKANLKVLHQVGLFHNLKSCDDYSCCTFLLCDNCMRRLNIFNKLSPGCWSTQHFYQERMHLASSSTPEEHSGNNCNCENCQQKSSGLPLLAQAVETIQKPITLKQKILRGFRQTEDKPTEKPTVFSCSTGPTTTPISTIIETTNTVLPSTSSTSILQPSTSLKSPKVMNCEHCGKSFTHRGDLNKHLRSHTGEQPYVCPVCNRRFTHTSNLSRHLRVHSGDRPFHCDRCNRDFSRKDKLIMHQKTKLCMKSQK